MTKKSFWVIYLLKKKIEIFSILGRIRVGSGSTISESGCAATDPHQNEVDPKHIFSLPDRSDNYEILISVTSSWKLSSSIKETPPQNSAPLSVTSGSIKSSKSGSASAAGKSSSSKNPSGTSIEFSGDNVFGSLFGVKLFLGWGFLLENAEKLSSWNQLVH